MKIEKINEKDYKVVNDAGTWLFVGGLSECKSFVETFKNEQELIPDEFIKKIGKIIDDCFCGEINRDEAIVLIWQVK